MIIAGRFSFVNVFTPKADLSKREKYSVQLLIPKDSTDTLAAVRKELATVITSGVSKGKFTIEHTRSARFKNPLRDGDEYFAEAPGALRESCKGHYFINASNTIQPGIISKNGQPIINPEDFYSGCYGLADVQFFAFNTNGNSGLGASLQNVMKQQDGDRLDGRQSATQAFQTYVTDASTEETEAGSFE